MNTSRDRDQSIERLLRQSRQAPRDAAVTDACLDGEAMAAWVDGGLSGAALEMAQSHVAECARCQSVVGAMARANALIPEQISHAAAERVPRRWLGWLVPLTAAAAVVTVWVAVSRDSGVGVRDSREVARQEPAARGVEPGVGALVAPQITEQARVDARTRLPERVPDTQTAKAEPAPQTTLNRSVTEGTQPAESRQESAQLAADSAKQDQAPAPAPAAAPAAPPPVAPVTPPAQNAQNAAQESAAGRVSGIAGGRLSGAAAAAVTTRSDVLSPNPRIRWRINGAALEHSVDAGASWQPVATGTDVQLTAGSAPSTSTCWVVGRAGVVLLTTDGRTWRRVAFPEITDLSGVRATDARTAAVTAADGRVFSTADAGVSWDRR